MTNDKVDGSVQPSGALLTINGSSTQTLFKSIQLLKLNITMKAKQRCSAHLRVFEGDLKQELCMKIS